MNTENIGSLGIIFFAVLGTIVLLNQGRKIIEKKSGESVSTSWMIYFAFLHVVIFIYGVEINSLPLKVNGSIRALAHIPIIMGLKRFKGFKHEDRLLIVLMTLITISMITLPFKAALFLVVSVGSIYGLTKQLIELCSSKTTGVLKIELLLVYTMANCFWIIYSFAIKNLTLEILNVSFGGLTLLIVILWFRYHRRVS